MPIDEALVARVRQLVAGVEGITEKRMFGGLAFLVHGNMSVGVHGSDLIVRIDPIETDVALAEPGARPFDIAPRPMKGWLMVAASALADKRSLSKWVKKSVSYASSLPRK
jgi:TfoX/Sxy family transcriptional regulator of competence genes